jgi:hypothetical protein
MKVYLISSEINNHTLYKIGITKREVKDRLKELKTGNAATLNIVNVFESKWATKIESNLHSYFVRKKIEGSKEWFNLEETDVNEFLERCQMIHNNMELISKNNTWYIDMLENKTIKKNLSK